MQEIAFAVICDLHLLCGPQIVISNESFKPLVQRCNDDLSSDLVEFVQDHIFKQDLNDDGENGVCCFVLVSGNMCF